MIMVFLDLKTIATIGIVLHTALALAMVMTYLTRKTYPGFRAWTIALVCWVVANCAFFSMPLIGDTATLLLGSVSVYLSAILFHDGLIRFHALKNRKGRVGLDVVVACMGFAVVSWNFFFLQNGNARVAVNSLVTGFILARGALSPLLVPSGRRAAQWKVSLGMGFLAGTLLVRATAAAFGPGFPGLRLADPTIKATLLVAVFAMVVMVYGFTSLMHDRLEGELIEAQAALREQAITDPLTGLLNRRGFMEMAGHDIRLASRYGQNVSLIMFDLDHFKSINDTLGHAVGDKVLAGIGRVVLAAMREVDSLARLGGEEFAVLMPQTGLEGARRTAERLRLMVKDALGLEGESVAVSASFGVAELDGGGLASMMERADACLYQAKRDGRDRVCARLLSGSGLEACLGERPAA